jgi:putative MATE family efflux protein
VAAPADAPRLTTGPVGRQLRALAVPMAVGFVALNSYSIADTFFVAQLGTIPLAAMGFTFPLAFALIAVGLGVGIGTSSVLARLLGAGDANTVQRITTHALMLGAALSLLLSVAGLVTIEPVFRALGADARTLPLIRDYMQVYYLGSAFLVLPMVGNFAIRATGDSIAPAVILCTSALVNVILDPLLIFGLAGLPRLELQGAAIATVAANAVTLVAAIFVLHRRERLIRLRHVGLSRLWDSWRKLLHVGIPATASNLLIPLTIAVITALVAGFGAEAVAGFGVASRVESVILIAVFALQSSLGPFVGQNYGMNRLDRIRRAIRLSNTFLLVYALLMAGLLFVTAMPVTAIFDDDPLVAASATAYLRIVPFTYGAFGVLMVAVACFNALGRPMPAAILTFVKFFVVYLPLAWLLSRLMGLPGIFWANAVAHLAFGAIAYAWLRQALRDLASASTLQGAPAAPAARSAATAAPRP